MRILYITEGFPYPLTSGYLRHYHLIRGLSERHEIHLFSIVGHRHRAKDVEAMRPFCAQITTFRSTAGSSFLRKATRRAADLVVARGSTSAARALAASVAKPLAEGAFDVVVMNGRRTITVLEASGETPVVADLCDAPVPRLQSTLRYSPFFRRVLIRLTLRWLERAEARLIAGAEHLLFASARDRDSALAGIADPAPSSILPNGVDVDYWRRTQQELGDEVVFSGAMHYHPNDDAARFLIQEVMPLAWREEPDLRVRVIGLNPTKALLALAGGEPRVTVTGFVDDVRPHLEHGAVYAAPLRFASGIQNKLLEAMAMELPVVTTAQGADGLRWRDDAPLPLTIAERADEFAAEIVSAVRRARSAPEPHRAGRAFVRDHFSWAQAVETLDRVVVATESRA